MNKAVKTYGIFWAILTAGFNAIVFVSPGWVGADKYTGAFWTGYIFTMIAMIVHLLVTIWVLKDSDESAKKLFYNIPVICLSYTFMIVSIIAGALCMLNSNMSVWIGVVVAVVLTIFYSGAIIKTRLATDAIQAVDAKVQTQTSFIRDLTAQAAGLKAYAKTPEAKEICEKVYDALRYSDPVSSDGVQFMDGDIKKSLEQFASSIKSARDDEALKNGISLVELIAQRNEKCKYSK